MTQIFTSGDGAQDLTEWAEKIICLAESLEFLDETGRILLAKDIGLIIKDYAKSILEVLSAAPYEELVDVFYKCKSPDLMRIDKKFKSIKAVSPRHVSLNDIQDTLSEINAVKEEVSFIFDIEKNLMGMLNGKGVKAAG